MRDGGQRQGRARRSAADEQAHVHIIDSASASMGMALLAQMAVRPGAPGKVGAEIVGELGAPARRRQAVRHARDARVPEARRPDQPGTRGDRQRSVGQADHHHRGRRRRDGRPTAHPRQGARSPARAAERARRPSRSGCSTARRRAWTTFAAELAKATGFPREQMSTHLIGPSVGPHVGPGAYGA